LIARYSRPQMTALWSYEAQLTTWLDIEVLACEGWAKIGKIPASDMDQIRSRAGFDAGAVLEREKITKHDVAAFVSVVQERIGPSGRFVHMGMTSSDVVDTALAYRMTKSADLVLAELKRAKAVTARRAKEFKNLISIGRTHGIHAEPMSFGQKWLVWNAMLQRAEHRLVAAREEIAIGKLSGAVGNYAHMPPEVEKHVCDKLGLKVDSISTQVIARDRFAAYFSALGILGSTIEAIAVELRHLQRTEVSEAREGFTKGQKGSSAMPHKRNPISAENLTGLARLLRAMVIPAMENTALWHERDISHSSVERVIAPDANILADYALDRLTQLLDQLEVFPDQIEKNLNSLHGVIYSQQVLLRLIDAGMSRDDAYSIVQSRAHEALDKQISFHTLLKSDKAVTDRLPEKQLDAIFNPASYLRHLDYLFDKVLGKNA
jgi:adenylosuccinate lyase